MLSSIMQIHSTSRSSDATFTLLTPEVSFTHLGRRRVSWGIYFDDFKQCITHYVMAQHGPYLSILPILVAVSGFINPSSERWVPCQGRRGVVPWRLKGGARIGASSQSFTRAWKRTAFFLVICLAFINGIPLIGVSSE